MISHSFPNEQKLELSYSYLPFYKRRNTNNELPFIDIPELVQLVSLRIKVLKMVSNKDNMIHYADDVIAALEASHLLGSNDREPEVLSDNLSHIFASFSYCHSKDQRDWFVRQETKIFNTRLHKILSSLDSKFTEAKNRIIHRSEFLLETLNNVQKTLPKKYCPWEINTTYEKELDIIACDFLQYYSVKADDPVITLPFEFCPLLIRKRMAVFLNGKAYVPLSNSIYVLCASFSLHLSDALLLHKKLFPFLAELTGLEDEENQQFLVEFLGTASRTIESSVLDFKSNLSASLTLSEIEKLASKSQYPPCMKELHLELKSKGSLKNYGRLQYGLFLKEIGLSYENSYLLFKEEFMKRGETSTKFDRVYKYGIRYNYGLEGGHQPFKKEEYSCERILNFSPPSVGELHGCPFKLYSKIQLRKLFTSVKIQGDVIEQFLARIEEGKYQEVCHELSLILNPQLINTRSSSFIGLYPSAIVKAVREKTTRNNLL